MTGDEARKLLDPRLLDICREWLSVLEETEGQMVVDLRELQPRVNRLLHVAYEAGRMREREVGS